MKILELKSIPKWYNQWHKHPRHQHAHWLFFFAVLILVFSFLSSEIGNFYLENEYQAQAQASTTITQSGDRWAVNGSQKFLLLVSYFDGLGASQTTLDSDFANLTADGFDGIRVLIDWPCNSCAGDPQYRLLNPDGSYQPGVLNRLLNLLQTASNHRLVVDLTFHDWQNFNSLAAYQTGLTNTARDIIGFRGVVFDLQNEANGIGGGLTSSQVLALRNAVKAVDPNRLVTASVAYGMPPSGVSSWFIPANLDFVAFHDDRSGDWPGNTDDVVNAIRASLGSTRMPVYLQEPQRYRGTGPYDDSADDWWTAAKNAKCSGAAAWTFHNTAGYDLTSGSIYSRFNSVENQIANGISGQLNSVGWFSCTTGLPPPPPGTTGTARYLYYLNPFSAQAGETIVIAGQNLATTVSFYDSSRTLTTAIGTLNNDGTEVTVTIPATLSPGQYSVSVGPNPDSNEVVGLEVLESIPIPTLGATGETSAVPCDPSITQLEVSIICDFYPESASPGSTIQVTGVALTSTVQLFSVTTELPINITGTVSNNGQLVTFAIPSNIALGDYTISDAGVTGTATITKPLTISSPQEQPPSNQPFNPPVTQITPPATPFQNLISNAFNYSLIIVGIAVFIMIMWGGFLWLTSAANPANIGSAKRYITNAILGAVLLVSAYVILRTINPELVGGSFNLQGIEAPSSQALGISRVIATTELSAASAIISGCIVDIDNQDFTALECDSNTANSLNLPLDPVITATDINVNNQIGATIIQNNGNFGAGRKIVVLDTGYNYNHPELKSSYLGGKDFINNDDDPIDDNNQGSASPGHGSHVAGIITGDGIDARARGVAPQTGIIAGKILDSGGNGNWSKTIEAIYWAVNGQDGIFGTADDFKADAINLSIGGGVFSSFCDNNDSTTKLMAQALKYARDNNVLPITAAGNSSNGIAMPGCIDSAFTVGAVDSSDRIANFSGRGQAVDVVAPGVDLYSSLLGNNYGLKRGTSQATPVVSGVAALIKAANPGYTTDQLEKALTSTACDLGPTGKDTTFGWGRVSLTPGSCTPPPPPPPPSGSTGTVTISPRSCTKGAISSNPNCNLNISYSITGITSATQLIVGKDGNLFQNIQCSSTPCSGQLTDPDPVAGIHKYDIRLSNNIIITTGNAYIYSTGTITSNFNSCSLGNAANPNCNITLNITALGVAPSSIVIIKDGINWRIVPCTTSPCSGTITDNSPTEGIHTYTLTDPANNARLSRTTINITTSGNNPGSESVVLCTGINFTGTCEAFNTTQIIPNLTNTTVGNDTVQSMRVINIGRVYLCRDINYGGLCFGFGSGDYADLSNYPVIGSGTASSMLESPILNRITLCSGINFTGTCEIIIYDDPDLSNNIIGDNNVSSIYVDASDASLYSGINYSGTRSDFLGTRYGSGIYPNLSAYPIGNGQASSIGSL